MTLLKRIVTSIVLFVPTLVIVYIGICIIGGAVCGTIASAGVHDPHAGYVAGQEAGENFVHQNFTLILWATIGLSVLTSLAVSFSNIFPWCREPKGP